MNITNTESHAPKVATVRQVRINAIFHKLPICTFYIGLFKNRGLSALIRTENRINTFIFNTLLAVRIKSVTGGCFHE